jgi:sarcosine oxidase subunit gamma
VTAESLARTSPLQAWSERFAALPDGVGLFAEPFVAQADLRVDPGGPAAARVAECLGAALPATPSTWVEGDAATAIWLGPDEWLVTNPFVTPGELEGQLRAAVGAGGGAVVDVSTQRTTLRLRGVHARDLLVTGCAVDLHPRMFAAGSAVQTRLGQVGVVLLALDDTATDYRILVRTSFARYLATWLVDAATEFIPAVVPDGS